MKEICEAYVVSLLDFVNMNDVDRREVENKTIRWPTMQLEGTIRLLKKEMESELYALLRKYDSRIKEMVQKNGMEASTHLVVLAVILGGEIYE